LRQSAIARLNHNCLSAKYPEFVKELKESGDKYDLPLEGAETTLRSFRPTGTHHSNHLTSAKLAYWPQAAGLKSVMNH
jgi:hypothetical protein